MSEKSSKGVGEVTATALEMKQAIIEIAGPRHLIDSRELWLDRAARIAGISKRTCKALFYCEIADPKASVVEKVHAAQKRKVRDDASVIAAGKREYEELLLRITRLEEALLVLGKDMHSDKHDAIHSTSRKRSSPLG